MSINTIALINAGLIIFNLALVTGNFFLLRRVGRGIKEEKRLQVQLNATLDAMEKLSGKYRNENHSTTPLRVTASEIPPGRPAN